MGMESVAGEDSNLIGLCIVLEKVFANWGGASCEVLSHSCACVLMSVRWSWVFQLEFKVFHVRLKGVRYNVLSDLGSSEC